MGESSEGGKGAVDCAEVGRLRRGTVQFVRGRRVSNAEEGMGEASNFAAARMWAWTTLVT